MSDLDDLRSLLKRIMFSNEHSDITISCGDYHHRVHRAIISAQSEVLAAMCNANFLEGKTGQINLPDDDPEAINIMVQELYGQSYKNTRPNLEDYGDDRALMNLSVYVCADKYNMHSLRMCAEEEFKAWASRSRRTESWAHVVEKVWEGNEFSGLYVIIEKQIADDIDRMLQDEWLSFVDNGMKLGRFSAAFLRHIVEKKDGIFYATRDTKTRYELDIIDLRSKIKGYRYTLEQLGRQMNSDTYDSD
ncbi:BTB/POZ domain protein [Penicillium brevicompactum]|uniref:BTB/POZ domain protein n=1 Tax=Penicillium brevicompactum TaxID=5074 RepID=A0A9W9V3C5_PENBR|nr:BTB/POZ domain protein [Penicillium brevicompactum]